VFAVFFRNGGILLVLLGGKSCAVRLRIITVRLLV
jgi:hypothetical protein